MKLGFKELINARLEKESKSVYGDALEAIIGAICHGVSAFLYKDQDSVVNGKNITGFSNQEEKIVLKVIRNI